MYLPDRPVRGRCRGDKVYAFRAKSDAPGTAPEEQLPAGGASRAAAAANGAAAHGAGGAAAGPAAHAGETT